MFSDMTAGRILLVDDSPWILEILRDGLVEKGYDVEVASGGWPGVELARERAFDVVVCDLHMDDLDGVGVIKEIQQINPQLPVIIISADEHLPAVLNAMREGAFDYVLKSGDALAPLLTAVRRALAHVQVLRENTRLEQALRETNARLEERLHELRVAMRDLRAVEGRLREANVSLIAARDQALSANRAKSLFLANVTHEFRTPLNAILGYSEMLLEELEDAGAGEFVPDCQKIHEAARHMLEFITNLLDLSKIEEGKMDLHLEPVDIEALVEFAVSIALPMAEKNGNTIEVDCVKSDEFFRTDVTKLRQILFNLLSNASKFTHDGAITVSVAYEELEQRWLHVDVRDTGIGMTEEQSKSLFQDFSQIHSDAEAAKKFDGSGLGLSICRRFSRMLRGDIYVESKLGEGSCFTLRIPELLEEPSQESLEFLKA